MEIEGLNLERLLTRAAQSGILLRRIRRTGLRCLRADVYVHQSDALASLCKSGGWRIREAGCSPMLSAMRRLRRRPTLALALLVYIAGVYLSAQCLWTVRIDYTGKDIGEIRTFLAQARIAPGRFKSGISPSAVREALMLRLPDLVFTGITWAGSTLVVSCQEGLAGESALMDGDALDLVAQQDGVITKITAYSGTPLVEVGQAVCAGDVLIAGEERRAKQMHEPVQAQGEVYARVWARAQAKVSMESIHTRETGRTRRRVTLHTPWHRHVVCDALPFEQQDTSTQIQPVIGLYCPLWREIETMAEIETTALRREADEAAALAMGAARQAALAQCPPGVTILDEWVETDMRDGWMYAAAVLAYESRIGIRVRDQTGE